jgi:hypothetical protein
MKNVTITAVKLDRGYRVIVVDDAKTDDNPNALKSHVSELSPATKEQLLSEVQKILSGIE